jgi:hypothetical protein
MAAFVTVGVVFFVVWLSAGVWLFRSGRAWVQINDDCYELGDLTVLTLLQALKEEGVPFKLFTKTQLLDGRIKVVMINGRGLLATACLPPSAMSSQEELGRWWCEGRVECLFERVWSSRRDHFVLLVYKAGKLAMAEDGRRTIHCDRREEGEEIPLVASLNEVSLQLLEGFKKTSK